MAKSRIKKRQWFQKWDPEILGLYDEDAEAGLIGAILLDSDHLKRSDISERDFFCDHWRTIYTILCEMRDEQIPITDVNLSQRLSTYTDVDPYMITEALTRCMVPSEYDSYMDTMKDLARRRDYTKSICHNLNKAIDLEVPLNTVLDSNADILHRLSWPSAQSRVVEFKNGRIICSDPPYYIFTLQWGGKQEDVHFCSDNLDNSGKCKHKIREQLHFNPILPGKDHWEEFVNMLLDQSKKIEVPEAARVDQMMIYWFQEWFKTAHEAETALDLRHGYIKDSEYYFFQPHPVVKWMRDHSGNRSINERELFVVMNPYGLEREVSKRIGNEVRKCWRLPRAMLDEQKEAPNIRMDDLSWLDE